MAERQVDGYSAPRNLDLHDRAQIVVPLLADRGLFALIPENTRGKLCPMASGGFTITLSPHCLIQPAYVLGLLNSRLLFWKLKQASNLFRGGWITCTKQYFGELPIRSIDFSDPADKAHHDKVVSLVEQMLALHRQLAAAKNPNDKTNFQREIGHRLPDRPTRLRALLTIRSNPTFWLLLEVSALLYCVTRMSPSPTSRRNSL